MYGSADLDPYKNLTDPEQSKYGDVQVVTFRYGMHLLTYGMVYILWSDNEFCARFRLGTSIILKSGLLP
jgi:hypothetical protein